MRKQDCFYVGRVVKPFSYNGEALIKLDTDDPATLLEMESVFIELGEDLVPFFVEQSQMHKSQLLKLKLEDIDSDTDVIGIKDKSLYLPLDLLPELDGKKFYYHEVMGFTVSDRNYGTIGDIAGIDESSQQALFKIEHKTGKNLLIPIHDDILQEVDRNNKTIHIQAPDGLIDLYLSD